MGGLGRDLRQAVRGLRKNPAFTLVVVATLALGIGANAAIFSLMDQVLFRALPVREPGALVLLDGPGPFRGRTHNNMTFSYPMYADFRDRNEVFAGVLARFQMSMTVGWKGVSERADGDLVSGNYFEVLGVNPALGRLFTAADDRTPGAHPVAVISYGYWQRRFGADPAILNQPLSVNGHPFTIVGVAGPGFNGIQVGTGSDVMVPLMMKGSMTPTWNDLDNRQSRWVNVMARLKPGVTADQAEVQLNVVYQQANEQEVLAYVSPSESFRKGFVEKHLEVFPGGRGLSDLRQQFSLSLIVLMSMVGVVLLIACANIANLLLARATTRQKEFAVRLALGAGRARIIRQQLVESLLLAVTGATLGLGLARWTGRLLISALPGSGPALTLSASPDLRVVGFTLTLAVLTAVVFGFVPALQATRPAVTSSLKEEAGSVAGGGKQARVRRALVVGQVAMSMLLLAGAGLFARSLHNLRSVDPGFRTESLISFSVDPSLSGYDQNRSLTLYQRLREELGAAPGVRAVSASEIGALTGSGWGMSVRVDGYQSKDGENMSPNFDGVGPGYFTTMGIPLVRGREFTDRDVKGAPRVAIINETMARYFFGESDPIGRRFGLAREAPNSIEIVGVVKDVRSLALRETPPRYAYLPYAQDDSLTQLTFYVRAAGAQAYVTDAIRQTVRRLDANLPVFDVKSMDTQVAESLYVERMVAWLSVVFGALATLLAAVGLYGVMSYAVARRTREIGVRMALGAEPAGVLWLVLKEVALLSSIGICAGLLTAFFAARRVESQLFGLTPTDPITLGTAVCLLLAVAMLAGFVPARRATRIDPLLALRTE